MGNSTEKERARDDRAALDREAEFKVTDTSPPPTPSIAYSDSGAQTIATDCLVIPSSGGLHTATAGGNVVYRMLSSTEKLDNAIFRHSSRVSPPSQQSAFLPEVKNDTVAIARLIGSDPRKTLKETLADNKGSKRAYFEKIQSFLRNCKETPGALIWFAGHGEEGTGDWVFSDGSITFEEISQLYGELFFNRILYIVCDCCYSGHWVTKLAKQLDEMGIRACGHQAKKVGFFLKVIASCEEEERAIDGYYIKAKGVCAAEDGSIQFANNKILWGAQRSLVLDTTSMRCFHDPFTECILNRMEHKHQWKWIDLVQRESFSKRFQFVCTRTHWYAVLFHEDKCYEIVNISERELSRSSFIVAKGIGIIPPKDITSKLCLYSPLNIDPYNLPHEDNIDLTTYYYSV